MATDTNHNPGPSSWRITGGIVAVACLWGLLAALRPTVTYHLAPALVVWAGPYLAAAHVGRALRATAGALTVALGSTLLLAAAGVLHGPAIVGGDATGEAAIVSVAAAAVATLVIGVRRRPGAPSEHDDEGRG